MNPSSTTIISSHDMSMVENVLLVGVLIDEDYRGHNVARQQYFEADLVEAKQLIASCNGHLVADFVCHRHKPDVAYFLGRGKIEELAQAVRLHHIDLVVFNHDLTPTQERNIERAIQCRVLDRVGLILAIFALRANSREGRLQVELAQLRHLSGRLIRGYSHLQSQRGGIGLKGPGETKLETDRRLIKQKIHTLEKQLQLIKKQRQIQNQNRQRNRIVTFALVGYTNVGKSSLFNRLTKSEVLAKDQLFATLDTTARRLYLSQGIQVLLTDTVGFVHHLPHTLIAAFSATLEETKQADVLLHIVDVSHPNYLTQIDDVNQVLQEIGAGSIPKLLIYNKIDKLPKQGSQLLMMRYPNQLPAAVYLSTIDGCGLPELRQALAEWAKAIQLGLPEL